MKQTFLIKIYANIFPDTFIWIRAKFIKLISMVNDTTSIINIVLNANVIIKRVFSEAAPRRLLLLIFCYIHLTWASNARHSDLNFDEYVLISRQIISF